MSKEKTHDDYLYENDPEQFFTLMELREGIETMGSDEFMEKYNGLDEPYKESIDEDISGFASGAVGDDGWLSNH